MPATQRACHISIVAAAVFPVAAVAGVGIVIRVVARHCPAAAVGRHLCGGRRSASTKASREPGIDGDGAGVGFEQAAAARRFKRAAHLGGAPGAGRRRRRIAATA